MTIERPSSDRIHVLPTAVQPAAADSGSVSTIKPPSSEPTKWWRGRKNGKHSVEATTSLVAVADRTDERVQESQEGVHKAVEARSLAGFLKDAVPSTRWWEVRKRKLARADAPSVFEAYNATQANVNTQEPKRQTDTDVVIFLVPEPTSSKTSETPKPNRRHEQNEDIRQVAKVVRQRFGRPASELLYQNTSITAEDVRKARLEWIGSAAANAASDAFSSTVVPLVGGGLGTAMISSQMNVENRWVQTGAAVAAGISYLALAKKVFVDGGRENWKLLQETGHSTVFLSRYAKNKAKEFTDKAKLMTDKTKEKIQKAAAWNGYLGWHGIWEAPVVVKTIQEGFDAGIGRAMLFLLSANAVGWAWNWSKIKASEAYRHSKVVDEKFYKYVGRQTKAKVLNAKDRFFSTIKGETQVTPEMDISASEAAVKSVIYPITDASSKDAPSA